MQPTILIWYRTDLRLHDHAPLHQAQQANAAIIPVYCFDPCQFGQTRFGFPKTGAFRAQFLLDSVADLRRSLQSLGSDLMVRQGAPETIIPQLAKQLGATAVYYHAEVTAEETHVEYQLATALRAIGVTPTAFWGHTLHHPDDLPFATAEIPELFTHFRKQVERDATIFPPLPAPTHLPPLPDGDRGTLPSLADWGLEPPVRDRRAGMTFLGGETAGRDRLHDYLWTQDCLKHYKDTRNGMLHPNDSSKLSP